MTEQIQNRFSDSVSRTASDALMAKASALSIGYQPIPEQDLLNDLHTPKNSSKARQTPLVSAGYAMRIASVAHTIHSFVSFHPAHTLNIIIMGCGLDVVGLWASHLAPGRVHIWEVDTLPVVQEKFARLGKGKWVAFDETKKNQLEEPVFSWSGQIQGNSTSEEGKNNYTLLAADFRDLPSLDEKLGQAFRESETRNSPTLILFELVLAYLEEDNTNELLEWCASTLWTTRHGVLVAFEALREKNDEKSAPKNIVQAYQREYKRQFEEKLNRGQADSSSLSSGSNVFQPLGNSCNQVEERMQRIPGFSKVYVCLAGTAACWAAKQHPETVNLTVPPDELFDEHAALLLHLSTYALVVAFVQTTENNEQFLFRRKICPWHYDSSTLAVPDQNHTFVVPLLVEDEAAIRELFSKTYSSLSEIHASVQKMVNAALKNELAPSEEGALKSSIRLEYQRNGGDFFVAVEYERGRQVVGGIGIRRWSQRNTEELTTYEIHRFFVDKNYQRVGMGSALVQMAESFVTQKSSGYRIVATTLVLLEGANQFYEKHGYALQVETLIGELRMRKYVKSVMNI
jgi:GNAT superfamily N-acetyltransferase/O-methyltransferase involved in polyketide biosynthesis